MRFSFWRALEMGGVEYEKEIGFQLIKAIAIAAHFIPCALRFYSCNLLKQHKGGD